MANFHFFILNCIKTGSEEQYQIMSRVIDKTFMNLVDHQMEVSYSAGEVLIPREEEQLRPLPDLIKETYIEGLKTFVQENCSKKDK